MIGIVDFGCGNLGSVLNMIEHLDHEAVVTGSIKVLERADALVLPGVGAFPEGMRQLKERGLDEALSRFVIEEGRPILGLCLGMQLMTTRSDEGNCEGLGWFDLETQLLPRGPETRVPHMGWNSVVTGRPDVLTEGLSDHPRFYFVHSYAVLDAPPDVTLLRVQNTHDFVAAIGRGNIRAVQFHPEKSHRYGMKLLSNFLELLS